MEGDPSHGATQRAEVWYGALLTTWKVAVETPAVRQSLGRKDKARRLLGSVLRDAIGQVMERIGYRRPNYVESNRIQDQFHYQKDGPAGIAHAHDFRWRLANPELFANLPSFDEVLPSPAKIPSLGKHARGPSDVHALLLACIHRVAHHSDSEEMLWLYDIHLLAGRMTVAGWEQFRGLAIRTGTRAACKRSLELTVQLFPTAVPSEVMIVLAEGRDEPSATFLRGSLREFDVQISNSKSLRSWRARWQLIRQNLFPAPSYMLGAYNVSNLVWLPALYIYRIVRGELWWFQPASKRSTT